MNIAEKIWYTWMVVAFVACIVAWFIDEDEHPKIFGALAFMVVSPLAIGFIGALIFVLIQIWK